MNIVIPLGGIGKRFQKAGYNTPKALVHCHGSPLLDKALSSIGNLENTQIYIAFHKVLDNWAFSERILEKYPEIRLLTLTRSTCGAADTLAIVAKKIEEERQNFPLISIDSDIFFKFSIQEILEKQENKNCCFYFEDQQKKPLYSYIKLNENQEVVDIAEKVKISQFANIGIYSFSSTKLYSKLFQDTVSKKQKASNSEIFISHVIKQAIKNGEKFSGINIHPEDYHCLGTPSPVSYTHLTLPTNDRV